MHLFPEGRARSEARVPGLLIVGVVAAVLLLFGAAAVDFVTEWQWFESLVLTSVLLTSVSARLLLFVVGAAVFLAIFSANVLVARRVAYGLDTAPRGGLGRGWEDLLAQVSAQ